MTYGMINKMDRIVIAISYLFIGLMLGRYYYPYTSNWDKRGYLGCIDGKMWLKNLDIDATTLNIPEGEYIIDLNREWCKNVNNRIPNQN
jgi:hypothetical protein